MKICFGPHIHLVWPAWGGSPSHPQQPRSKRTYRQLRSQTAEAASFDSGGFMGPGGGPPIDGDSAMQSHSPPVPSPPPPSFLPSLPLYCCDMPRPHSGHKRRQCNLKLWNFFKNKKLHWAALRADLGRMRPSGRRLDKPALEIQPQLVLTIFPGI